MEYRWYEQGSGKRLEVLTVNPLTRKKGSMQAVREVQVINRWEDLEKVRQFWETAVNHPNASYALFLNVLRRRANIIRPHILVAVQDGQVRAIVLCRHENMVCNVGVGYLRFFKMRVPTLVVMHGGVLGDCDDVTAELIASDLKRSLSAFETSRILFNNHKAESSLVKAVLRKSSGWTRGFHLKTSAHWAIQIPATPGEFLARMKSKHRSYLRKMQRDLETAFPGTVSYQCFRAPGEVLLALSEVEHVASKTYQRGLEVGVCDNSEYANRFMEEARRGRLRIWVLRAGGQARAFRIGLVYGNTIHGAGIGYDSELKDFRLGNLLLLHAIDELAREGVREYDLGLGDAAYKQQFGNYSWKEVTFSWFSGSIRGQYAKLVVSIPYIAERFIKLLMSKCNVTDRIKRIFRDKAAGRVNERC
jgi:hypothetical protein